MSCVCYPLDLAIDAALLSLLLLLSAVSNTVVHPVVAVVLGRSSIPVGSHPSRDSFSEHTGAILPLWDLAFFLRADSPSTHPRRWPTVVQRRIEIKTWKFYVQRPAVRLLQHSWPLNLLEPTSRFATCRDRSTVQFRRRWLPAAEDSLSGAKCSARVKWECLTMTTFLR